MKTEMTLFIMILGISLSVNSLLSQTCMPYNTVAIKIENDTPPANILEAKYFDGITYLKWIYGTPAEDSYFLVQKSDNGFDFKTIGIKECYGDSIKINILYCYKDELSNIQQSKIYYRIAKPLEDGNFMYSNICTVSTYDLTSTRIVENTNDF